MTRRFAIPMLLALAACGGEALPDPMMMMTATPPPDTSSHDIDVASPPCGVAVVLAGNCASCHGSPPTQNATVSLLSYADLMKPFAGGTNITLAQRSLLRMRATVGVMPPSGPASDADIAAFAAWIEAGALPGSCTQDPATSRPSSRSRSPTPRACASAPRCAP